MLITNKLPNSLSAESYKSLRNNIEKIAERDNIKTLLITSSVSGEGKSTISGNLAVSLSENNNKVFGIFFRICKHKDILKQISNTFGVDRARHVSLDLLFENFLLGLRNLFTQENLFCVWNVER